MMTTLSGCQSYTPAPLDPAQMAVARQNRPLDLQAVQREYLHIAPGATYVPAHWDRLSLLAAVLINNADVAAARAAVTTALAAAKAARTAPGATLTLSSEYANDPAASSPWLLGGAVDVPIDAGGRRSARLDSASLSVAIARYDYADTLWSARMQVVRALADTLIAEREESIARQLLVFRTSQQSAMMRRLQAGAVNRAELERVRADAASAASTTNDAHSRLVAARQSLAAAIGVPVAALDGLTFDWQGFDAPSPDPLLAPAAQDRIGATLARADILKALAAYDQAESDLRGEVARQYPAISIAPGYTWERGLVKLPLSVGLALPPLDLNRSAIATAEAKRTEAGRKLETVVAAATAALDGAISECRLARQALARIRSDDVPVARRLAAQADRELRRGQIDRSDWAAAQAGATQIRLVELTALARVHAADAALEDALRRPLEGPELRLSSGALDIEI